MTEEEMEIFNAREAAEYLRISMYTLQKVDEVLEEMGEPPYRTPGGHRRYSLRLLNRYLDESRGKRRRTR